MLVNSFALAGVTFNLPSELLSAPFFQELKGNCGAEVAHHLEEAEGLLADRTGWGLGSHRLDDAPQDAIRLGRQPGGRPSVLGLPCFAGGGVLSPAASTPGTGPRDILMRRVSGGLSRSGVSSFVNKFVGLMLAGPAKSWAHLLGHLCSVFCHVLRLWSPETCKEL